MTKDTLISADGRFITTTGGSQMDIAYADAPAHIVETINVSSCLWQVGKENRRGFAGADLTRDDYAVIFERWLCEGGTDDLMAYEADYRSMP